MRSYYEYSLKLREYLKSKTKENKEVKLEKLWEDFKKNNDMPAEYAEDLYEELYVTLSSMRGNVR